MILIGSAWLLPWRRISKFTWTNSFRIHIPDIYRYMEPALIDELKAALSGHVGVPE
jgi:hypothetical protein